VIAREVDVTAVAAVTAREEPDVALVGLGLSSQHALELIEQIVHESSCPVIALLSVEDTAYVREAAKRGVFAYLVDTTPEEGPGVYDSSSAILINSALTLDGGGDPNAVFIFRAVSDLTVEVGASISYTNGAQPCNVFWKVDSAWLKNSGSTFVGTILALTQITLTDNITVQAGSWPAMPM